MWNSYLVLQGSRIINLQSFGLSLYRVSRGLKPYRILESFGFSCGFQDGACLIFALALQECLRQSRPDLVELSSLGFVCLARGFASDAEHAVLRIDHPTLGRICLDSDGLGTTQDHLEKFNRLENLGLETPYYREDLNLKAIQFGENQECSTKLAEYFLEQLKEPLLAL